MSSRHRTQLLVRTAYDGSLFRGVTPQPGLPTVGGALRARLEGAFGVRARSLVVAARTDAGVHAVENLATCWLGEEVRIEAGLARLRGPGGGLLDCQAVVVPRSVFARTVGVSKHYRYRLEGGHDPGFIAELRLRDLAARKDPGLPRLPPEQGAIWQVAPSLDPAAMRAAARHIVGTHDFRSFKVGPLGDRSPVRTVTSIEVHALRRAGRPHIVVDVRGRGFLRKMVRIVVGTIAEAGAGLRHPDDLGPILAAHDRQVSGQAALARGLALVRIETAVPWFEDQWAEPAGLPQP